VDGGVGLVNGRNCESPIPSNTAFSRWRLFANLEAQIADFSSMFTSLFFAVPRSLLCHSAAH
jgi:hypothetical protein